MGCCEGVINNVLGQKFCMYTPFLTSTSLPPLIPHVVPSSTSNTSPPALQLQRSLWMTPEEVKVNVK